MDRYCAMPECASFCSLQSGRRWKPIPAAAGLTVHGASHYKPTRKHSSQAWQPSTPTRVTDRANLAESSRRRLVRRHLELRENSLVSLQEGTLGEAGATDTRNCVTESESDHDGHRGDGPFWRGTGAPSERPLGVGRPSSMH